MKGFKAGICKILALVLALVLSLTACSGKKSSTSSTTKEPDKLVIGFWTMGNIPSDMQAVLDAANKILIKKDNCEIQSIVALNFGNYRSQMQLMLSGNEHLDAFACYYGDFVSYAVKGQIVDMTSLLSKYGSGISKALGSDYLKCGQVGGKQYGVTTCRDLATENGFVFVKKVLDKYNIDPTKIKTLDDVASVFQTVKQNEPGMIPLATQSTPMMDQIPQVDKLGDNLGVLLNWGQKDTKVVNYFDTDEYANYCKYFRQWYLKGYMTEDVLTNSNDPNALQRSGKALATTSNLKPGFDTKQSLVDQTTVVSVPIVQTYTTTSTIQTAQWVIARNSTARDATMKFLNEMYINADLCNLLSWGIEGKDYVKTSDGHIDYPAGVTSSNSGYNLQLGWVFGNQYLTHVWAGDPIDLYQQLQKWNKSAVKSKAFGFSYDSSNVKTQVAACTNVLNQYRRGLEYGAMDPDTTLPKFRAALKAAGIDQIVAEKQKQLDAWLKSNSK